MNITTSPRRRVITMAFASLLSVVAVLGVTSDTPASASASGCSGWGAKSVGGWTVGTGVYCVYLNGNGTYVANVAGSFNAAGSVCNWNITAEFFDSSGRWYRTVTGPTHWGCTWKGGDVVGVYSYVQRGFMCSTLKQNGGRIQSVCHNIY